MPNHVTNRWAVQAPDKQMMIRFLKFIVPKDKLYLLDGGATVQDYVQHTDEIISFESIMPVPEELQITAGFGEHADEEAYAANKEKYGARHWYDWCPYNWGTKWDAYDIGIHNYSDTYIDFSFNTAWSPPVGIMERLRRLFPQLTFEVKWADEDIGNNTGHIVFQGLDIVSGGEFENGSKEAYEMAFELTGGEDYFYWDELDQEYKYKED